MNLFGKEGPTSKQYFVCDNCKFLSETPKTIWFRNLCLHPDLTAVYNFVDADKKTPFFCPFLLKKIREEKLINLK